MGIGDTLLNKDYVPDNLKESKKSLIETPYIGPRIIKCPVKFTDDALEFLTGSEFMDQELRPKQQLVIEDLFYSFKENGKPKYTEAILILGMRCHGLGTEILMYDGTIKKIEDIIIGDQVMGPDSKPRNVLEICTGKDELYRVGQTHGMSYVVNSTHKLSLKVWYGHKKYWAIVNTPISNFINKEINTLVLFKGYKADFIQGANLSDLTITSIGKGNFAGIRIDKDHLYCLKDGTVTVNSGKSVLASFVTSFLTQKLLSYDIPSKALGQKMGQQLTAEFIATSEEQTLRTAYASFVSDIQQNPWWIKYINYLTEREKAGEGIGKLFQNLKQSIFFREKNVIIQSLNSNSNSLAGMTSYSVVFDEMSRFKVSDGQNQGITEATTAQAVYNTASRSAKSLAPFSRVLTVTSPIYETDYGMELLYMAKDLRCDGNLREISLLRKKHPPKQGYNENMIAYNYSTYEAAEKGINRDGIEVGYTEDDFINERNSNPVAYRRDYIAVPPGSENPYFEYPERIEMCINPEKSKFDFVDKIVDDTVVTEGIAEMRSYIAKDLYTDHSDKMKRYFLSVDGGVKKDKFVVAMGHVEDYSQVKDARQLYKIKIDFVEAWHPDPVNKITVSFPNVEEIIKALANKFNILQASYDSWQSVESLQRLFTAGVKSVELGITTKMYDEFKRMVYNGLVELPRHDLLTNELRQLNLVRGTTVDHPKAGCFTGDTKIELLDGTQKTFEELAKLDPDQEFWVYSSTLDGKTIPAKAFNSRITKTITKLCFVELDNGALVRCTPEHLFLLNNGIYKQAQELKYNDRMMSRYSRVIVTQIYTYILDSPIPVYDITVPIYENFALSSNTFVHNSKDCADAVCRVVISCYNDYLESAANGDMMVGQSVHLPTIGSITQLYRDQATQMQQSMNGTSSVFGDKEFYITRNIHKNSKNNSIQFEKFLK